MTVEPRSMSLGRRGEEYWGELSSALRLEPGGLRALVLADKSDVRREVRRRLEATAAAVEQLAPSVAVLEQIHELAAAAERPPVVWIEAAPEQVDAEAAWLDALRALNRGRDLIGDRGPVSVVLAGPQWLQALAQRSAPDLSSVLSVTVLLDDTLEPLPELRGPLCWMHLSDLHVLSDDWEQDVVLGALVRDLPGLLEQVGRTPQVLFVTGDLAARGDEKEYDGVFRTLERICEVLGVSRRSVFLVPGNHDVQRSRVSSAAKLYHGSLLELRPDPLRTQLGELLGDAEGFGALYGRRLAHYCRFTERFLGLARAVSFDRPWRSDVVELSGVPVGVASICTAWSSGSDKDKGNLLVGERQLRELIRELEQGGAALRVALLHHPVSWLCEDEERELRALLRKEFDLVLHGHVHDSAADAVHRQRRGMLEVGAGAAYAGLGQDRYHGFWIGWLDPDEGRVELDAFTWDGREGGRWRRDAGFSEDAPEGRLSLTLKLARLGGAVQSGARADAIADALRRAAARVQAGHSFLGLPDSAPKPKATLDSMFVPLSFARGDGERGTEVPLRELEPQWIRPAGEGEVAARVVILGAPGSGKSTLCRYLAMQTARAEAGPVPLLLTVRSWAAEGARDGILAGVAREAGATLAVRVDEQTLADLCAAGRAVLLVDGIDEVSPQRRAWLRDCVHGFCESYPRVPVVVTSRPVGYDRAPLDDGFVTLRLEPFGDEQLFEFIERWYEIAEPDNPSERLRRRSDLRAALEAEPRAKELARTPLLATLIALVHRHQAHLPGDRARLYQLCIELLVVTWPAERGRALAELDGYWQIARLEELALWMQRRRLPDSRDEREILVSGAELERRLIELLAEHRDDLDDGLRRSLAVKWRRWLVEDSGVMQEFECDRFGFLHLSLMEYLAGRGVLREYGGRGYEAIAAFVDEHHEQSAWRECLLLMLGSEADNRDLATAVVTRLLSHAADDDARWPFMVDMLREEVEISSPLVVRILEGTTSAAGERESAWDDVSFSLGDIIVFGRLHGPFVRSWLMQQLVERRAEALVGIIFIAPLGIEPTPEMEARSDEDLGIEALLEFHPTFSSWFPWGPWARARARPDTLLRWSCTTPISGIFVRSVNEASSGNEPRVWVIALMRRAAWAYSVMVRAAEMFTGHDRRPRSRIGVNAGGDEWQVAAVPGLGSNETGPYGELGFGFERFFDTSTSGTLAGHWCWWLSWFPRLLVDDFLARFASDRLMPLARVVEKWRPMLPREWGVDPLPFPKGVGAEAELRLVAEAYAGQIATPTESDPAILSTLVGIRVENCWINLIFDFLVKQLTADRPLDPQRHALLLALGLAQYQTTHAWPDSDHWRSWFATDTPPEYWLAAYVWHLCRGIADPANPEHFTRAEACLERGDWPELVAELRKYPIRPTPPEVLALFARE